MDRGEGSHDDARGDWKSVLVHKSVTQERSNGWQKVADTLNPIEGFHVTDRAIRDKINALVKKYRPLINKNIQGTGLGGDKPTEHEVLVEEVINIFDDTASKAQEAAAEATEKERTDREAALDVRCIAMEHRAETAERKKTDKKKDKLPKRSSSDTIEFLRLKMEFDRENRQRDRELQENQIDVQNQLFANLLQSNQQMMAQQTILMQELLKQKQKE